jgi:hypothetical protein
MRSRLPNGQHYDHQYNEVAVWCGNPCGFLLTANDGQKLYLAQDSGLLGDMKLIGKDELDFAVPIGDNFTIGPDDALRAVKMLQLITTSGLNRTGSKCLS